MTLPRLRHFFYSLLILLIPLLILCYFFVWYQNHVRIVSKDFSTDVHDFNLIKLMVLISNKTGGIKNLLSLVSSGVTYEYVLSNDPTMSQNGLRYSVSQDKPVIFISSQFVHAETGAIKFITYVNKSYFDLDAVEKKRASFDSIVFPLILRLKQTANMKDTKLQDIYQQLGFEQNQIELLNLEMQHE